MDSNIRTWDVVQGLFSFKQFPHMGEINTFRNIGDDELCLLAGLRDANCEFWHLFSPLQSPSNCRGNFQRKIEGSTLELFWSALAFNFNQPTVWTNKRSPIENLSSRFSGNPSNIETCVV
jgi:hypothetical protein